MGKLRDPRKRLELVSAWEGREGLGPQERLLSHQLKSWEEEKTRHTDNRKYMKICWHLA